MDKFIMTVIVIFLVYLCIYAVVNRICKCVEHHTEYMYRSFVNTKWMQDHQSIRHQADNKNREDGSFCV